MGLLGRLFGKKEISEKSSEEKKEGGEQSSENAAKYSQECTLCGGANTEKKWMGQYWHKKCLKGAKRASKKMI